MYVGQTCKSLKERARNNGSGYEKSPFFYKAILKYGWDNFEGEIVADHLTHDEANDFEISLINNLKTREPHYGYNLAIGGNNFSTIERENLIGKNFGFWKVIAQGDRRGSWKCQCICGKQHEIIHSNLINNRTSSCGCEGKKILAELHRTHGLSNSSLYVRWQHMIYSCYKKSNKNYKYNGALGIKVCDEWLGVNGFYNFYTWAIENDFSVDYRLDRINIDFNFSPNNCRWVSIKEKSAHRKDAVLYKYNGKEMNLEDWSKYLGIKRLTLWNRIHISKMSVEEAFTTPVAQPTIYEANGEVHTIDEWSKILNVKKSTLKSRLYRHPNDLSKVFYK